MNTDQTCSHNTQQLQIKFLLLISYAINMHTILFLSLAYLLNINCYNKKCKFYMINHTTKIMSNFSLYYIRIIYGFCSLPVV